jgi:hypothetical protein
MIMSELKQNKSSSEILSQEIQDKSQELNIKEKIELKTLECKKSVIYYLLKVVESVWRAWFRI